MKVLITLGNLGTKKDYITKMYDKFSTRCLGSVPDIMSTKRDFREIGDLFIHNGEIDHLSEQTIKLSEQLQGGGNSRLGDLLINELGKLFVKTNNPDKAAEILKIALENCRRKNDELHELARLIDLEKIYKSTNDRKSLFYVLSRKKDCCKRIVEHYEESVKNYDSIVKIPTSKQKVSVQLAFTYSDLAGMLERRKPHDALKMYKKAREIYERLNLSREAAFLTKKIDMLGKKYNL